MTLSLGRATRLSALALATGTVVVAATTGVASAAPASAPAAMSYAGNTGSSVASLAINIPGTSTLGQALAGTPLSSLLSNGITLSLIDQTGALSHSSTGKSPNEATSTSSLAGGTLFDKGGLLAGLNEAVSSSLTEPSGYSNKNVPMPSDLSGILNLGIPTLDVQSNKSAMNTDGNSDLANVSVGTLASLLPAGSLSALQSALGTGAADLSSAATGATGTLVTTINTTLSSIDTALGTANIPVSTSTALTDLKTSLTQLEGELPTVVNSLEDGSLVSLKGLWTGDTVTTAGAMEVSQVASKLASLSLLGGFVTLSGFSNSLTTEAGGSAGTSHVETQPNVAKVTLGLHGELAAILGPNGLSLSGTLPAALNGIGATLVTSVDNALSTVQNSLNEILDIAGVKIEQDAVTKNVVAANGSSAAGALSGLSVIVDPLSGELGALGHGTAVDATTAPLIDLNIGSLTANSTAAFQSSTVLATKLTKMTVATGGMAATAPNARLAFTGANLPLTGAIATALLAAGAVLSRRRRSTTTPEM